MEGESKELIRNYGIGETFEPENETDLILKINQMSKNPKDYTDGFNKLINDFDRKKMALTMLEFIMAK